MNQILILTLFLSSLFAADTSSVFSLTPMEKGKLAIRCFVWKPENCNSEHKKADMVLIEAVRKKSPLDKASIIITQSGWKLFDLNKDFMTALDRFNEALIIDPQNAEAWAAAGTVYAAWGDSEQAETLFKRAREKGPKSNRVGFIYGRYLWGNKKDKRAAEVELDRAGKFPSRDKDFFLLWARVKMEMGKNGEAAKAYRRALNLGAGKDPSLDRLLASP